jgi:hypothetical protein
VPLDIVPLERQADGHLAAVLAENELDRVPDAVPGGDEIEIGLEVQNVETVDADGGGGQVLGGDARRLRDLVPRDLRPVEELGEAEDADEDDGRAEDVLDGKQSLPASHPLPAFLPRL